MDESYKTSLLLFLRELLCGELFPLGAPLPRVTPGGF